MNESCQTPKQHRNEDGPGAASLDTLHGLVGCPVCGGKLIEIRGKHPGDPKREVCPTCLADRMDMIRDMSDPNYGIGCAANSLLGIRRPSN